MSPIVQSSDWIAPGEAESDFVLQRWIDFWGSRQQQIFLFFSADYPLRSFTIDLHPLIRKYDIQVEVQRGKYLLLWRTSVHFHPPPIMIFVSYTRYWKVTK